jgi:hypothetical protein
VPSGQDGGASRIDRALASPNDSGRQGESGSPATGQRGIVFGCRAGSGLNPTEFVVDVVRPWAAVLSGGQVLRFEAVSREPEPGCQAMNRTRTEGTGFAHRLGVCPPHVQHYITDTEYGIYLGKHTRPFCLLSW